ncbi:MAG: hypothetical protein PHQ53_03860 [Candidatus Krumholzibacteria bacterium]|nr:hypothetical protein [Candidatus Krumholzibacteria bacterium]
MQHRQRTAIAICALVALGAVAAHASWYDGFESYIAGGGLHGQGGWAGWNDDPAGDAVVSDLYAFAGTQSVAISGAADIVQMFSGYTTGIWNLIAWMYIPTGFTGETYFIVLNTYAPNGTQNWSTQIHFTNGMILTDTAGQETIPYVVDQWAELKLVIDLQSDLQTFYYNGAMMYQASWSQGVSGGGAVNIGCLDLFANGASPVYYDEISLTSSVVAVESTTLTEIKSLFR